MKGTTEAAAPSPSPSPLPLPLPVTSDDLAVLRWTRGEEVQTPAATLPSPPMDDPAALLDGCAVLELWHAALEQRRQEIATLPPEALPAPVEGPK